MSFIVDKGFDPLLAVESSYDLCDGKGGSIFSQRKIDRDE